MKKVLLVLCATILLSSCASSSLVGNYSEERKVETDLKFDNVWSNVIDYFTDNGYPITTMDKSSGFIVSGNVSIGSNLVTTENGEGKLVNPNAYIVTQTGMGFTYGFKAKCDFNVRVKEINGKVGVKVNITNIRIYVTNGFGENRTVPYTQVYSTGVFEKQLLQLLTTKQS